jgi:RimJ/RimL family protein N-acetyltransferase
MTCLKRWCEQPHIQRTCSHKLLTELIEGSVDERDERHDFVVQDESESPVGLVSLFRINRTVRQAETAKLVGEPAALGAGYAHEATCLLLGYAFHNLDLQRVYLRTNGFNLQNIGLNEKIGFRFEGILRASDVLNQELVDVVLMSMLGREFYRRYRVRELTKHE